MKCHQNLLDIQPAIQQREGIRILYNREERTMKPRTNRLSIKAQNFTIQTIGIKHKQNLTKLKTILIKNDSCEIMKMQPMGYNSTDLQQTHKIQVHATCALKLKFNIF